METRTYGHDMVKRLLRDFAAQGDYFSHDDTEELLTHTDPGEALEEHIENLLERGDTAADIEGKILGNETFELFAYKRDEITEDAVTNGAELAIDAVVEQWAEEYGDPDGEHDLKPTDEIRSLFRAAVLRLYATEPVWRCQQVGPALELDSQDVLAWARVERKDWFE